MPTQKEELATLQAENIDLKDQLKAKEGLDTKLTEAEANLTAAEKARDDEKARADKAEAKIGDVEKERDTEKARADKADGELQAATEQVTKLEEERDAEKARADKAEKDVTNADQRHAEQLASRNINPVNKAANPGEEKPAAATAEQIKEQYAAIENKEERRAFYQKHKATLLAA